VSRLLARLGVVMTVAAALFAGNGAAALAHVTVHSDDAEEGASAEIAFRVPNESNTASTTTVSVAIPTDKPLAEVTVLPQEGWTYQITRTPSPTPLSTEDGDAVSEVVSQVTWQAANQDTAVKPGEYQVFRIVAGPLPKTDWLVFKVVQTYTDGQVQRWIDDPLADGEEPAHPAALLPVNNIGGGAHNHNQPASGIPTATPQQSPSTAMWWAAIAIAVVSLLTALTAVIVTTRSRSGGKPTT
jgi:periplasmic copper chaperone A